MFSFQKIKDPLFEEINLQDLGDILQDHVPMAENINHHASKSMRLSNRDSSSVRTSLATVDGVGDGKDDLSNKKLIHRENEKQRRKQMANLYASLRSLLPLEFIKGKRSTSDNMHEAVKYIKYMKENIEVLGVQRDQLKKFTSTVSMNPNESFKNLLPNTVFVNSCNGGVEILINSYSIQEGFLPSRVVKALVEEGHSIISCTSTKVSQRLLHTIRSEANDPAWTDFSLLQQRLTAIVNDLSN